MANDLLIRIDADALGYSVAMGKAEASTIKFGATLEEANAAMAQTQASMDTAPSRRP